MALTRGSIVGYDAGRMMFEFTMVAPDARLVRCQVSSVAMDQMDRGRGTAPSEREAQFIRLRDAIEKIASDIFKDESPAQGGVRIFEKHLPEGRGRRTRKSPPQSVA
jgi:hypothetical protein